jgi:predicted nucleic acid-binding protein
MLVDSSVWIAYLRGDNRSQVALLTNAPEHGETILLAPPILRKVLQGADGPDRLKRSNRVLGELRRSARGADCTPRACC